MKLTEKEIYSLDGNIDNFRDLVEIITGEPCCYSDIDVLKLSLNCLKLCYLDGYVTWEEVENV